MRNYSVFACLIWKYIHTNTLDLPIRRGEVLLLLEALLQAHELELREDRPTAPALLGLAAVGAVVLQLAAEVEVQREVVRR